MLMTFIRKNEDIFRLLAAFAVSQLLSVALMLLFDGMAEGYLYSILLNVVCVLAANTAVYLMICGKGERRDKSADYRRYEPVVFLFGAVFLSCAANMVTRLILPVRGGEMPQGAELIAYTVYTVVLAPVSEELAFRKAALDRLSERSENTAAIVSALFFAAYHMSADMLLYTFVLGYFLGRLALRSGSVLPCIAVHAANNLLTVAVAYSEAVATIVNFAVPVLGAAGLIWLVLSGRIWCIKSRNR